MVCMVLLISNPGQVLTAGCEETPEKARLFILDHSKEVSQEREQEREIALLLETNCFEYYVSPAGTEGPSAGSYGLSSKLFDQASSTLGGF